LEPEFGSIHCTRTIAASLKVGHAAVEPRPSAVAARQSESESLRCCVCQALALIHFGSGRGRHSTDATSKMKEQ
jgi:hypothetical protein